MPQKLIRFITMEEGKKLIAKEEDKKFKLAYALALGSGLRLSEVLGYKDRIKPLTKEQIDLQAHTIRILGKGNKERITVTSPMLNENNIKLLPLKIHRRRLQRRILKLGLKVLGRKITYHCVSGDTEILTKVGWKKYNELRISEEIYTFNIKKNLIELKKLKEIFKHEFNGDLYKIKNKYIDSLITEEHKLPLRISVAKKENKNYWKPLELIKLNNLLFNIKSKRDILYKLSGLKHGGKSIGKAKAGILGWILSDAHISKKNQDIIIQQSLTANKDKCEVISKLLKDSGLKYYIRIQKEKISDYSKRKSQIIVFRISKENTDWIFEFINKDRTPKYNILKLNKEELEEVYKNMMLGDGTNQNVNSREYAGQNKDRILFLRTLCCLLAKRTTIGTKKQRGKNYNRLYIINKDECQVLEKKHISKEKYNGIVWCPSTDNGTFIAKRNNSLFITGNTLRHGFANFMVNEKNIPLPNLQTLLGHSRLDTTGIYTKSNPVQAIEKAWEVF